MELAHVHAAHAPRKRFRGRRRYFRRVHREASAFELEVTGDAWWDLWHYHADWPGWGNLRGRYRREHLRALCRVFQTIALARERFATPFQLWIMLSGDDAGMDATYLHTPNANDTPFPFTPRLVPTATSPFASIVQPMLADFSLAFATHTDDDDGNVYTSHWIWAHGVGESLGSAA
jgi:hypothetical protein